MGPKVLCTKQSWSYNKRCSITEMCEGIGMYKTVCMLNKATKTD